MSHLRKPQGGRMRAQQGDPWVSVSLLGECTFCQRAGRFQQEQSQEDTGEEEMPEPPRRGWYRPPFTVAEIEQQLRRLVWQAALRGLIAAILAVATWVMASRWLGVAAAGPNKGFEWLEPRVWLRWLDMAVAGRHGFAWAWPFVSGLACLVLLKSTLGATFACIALRVLLTRARAADTGEPDPDASQPQRVNWWSLLQCGFAPGRYEDPLSDPAWRVTGKPWRVLHRGSERIPVFRKRNEDEKLYRQHFARIAAYAHLIETTEGAIVPYGLILLGSSYRGLTVPVEPSSKKQFHDALILARTVVKGGPHQPPPRNVSLCWSCPWGKPMTEDYGETYSSPCGDRYNWVPPHEKALRKGLA